MVGETRVLANCGYGTPICQTLNQAQITSAVRIDRHPFKFSKSSTL
jgi:hypothetical protein